jgi:oligopeptide transport system ATP-binding protein
MEQGEILGIVGESGSGKSVTALSIMGLIEDPGRIIDGTITFNGRELTELSDHEMGDVRGKDIAMIFQDPMTSLNPVFSISNQMVEVILRHTDMSRKEAKEHAINMLNKVGIPQAKERINSYPFEFSGGMRQRAMIATALSCNPKLLIADEPTTALDVTIQAQIVDLVKGLRDELGMGIIWITHDLGVIAEICTKVIVMYGGMVMESGTVNEIFHESQHPYTIGLHHSIPRLDLKRKERLIPIKGSPPDLMNPPEGCPFSTRCQYAMRVCLEQAAPLFEVSEGHRSSCWLLDENAPAVDVIKSKAKVR